MKQLRRDSSLTPAKPAADLPPSNEENMGPHMDCNTPTPALAKGATVLMAAFMVLSTGCAPRVTAIPAAIEQMTVEITQNGDPTYAYNGDNKQLANDPSRRPNKERYYLFGKGIMADLANLSFQIPAVCFWEEGSDPKIYCWPNDRSAWIQLTKGSASNAGRDGGKIKLAYYQTDNGKSVPAGQPIGSPNPEKVYWYGGLHSCPYCFFGPFGCFCWDPCP